MPTNLAHNNNDDQGDYQERRPENPWRLRHSVACYIRGIGSVQPAKHNHNVIADRDVLTQVYRSEKIHHIVTDRSIVICTQASKKHDNVVLRLVGDMHVAEENYDIVIDVSIGIDTAEKTDRIMDRVTFGHHDVAAKLHSIFIGACRRS